MFWVWAILLLVLGLGLAMMEIFFPSAGILGFLAFASLVGSIILGFQHGPWTGLAIMIVTLFGVPTVIVVGLRVWPRTSIGRKVLLTPPRREDVVADAQQRERLHGLVGKIGRAKCKMLPGGAVTIDGHTFDAFSEGVPIENGDAVRVIQVRGSRLVVRRVDDELPQEGAPDPLRRPIDTIVPDPFDEPSA